jgi:hypothetical protein
MSQHVIIKMPKSGVIDYEIIASTYALILFGFVKLMVHFTTSVMKI